MTYTQDQGDIGIRGFWAKQMDSIIDIRITYPEANSNRNSTVEKKLEKQEKEKKKKYLQPCLGRSSRCTSTSTKLSFYARFQRACLLFAKVRTIVRSPCHTVFEGQNETKRKKEV